MKVWIQTKAMITEIYMENWKSHEKTVMKFAEGTNVLVGIMGSGKTSTLDAVSFALFGTFPALKQKKVVLRDAIRKKPNRAKKAMIKVKFQAADNQEYEVKRTIEKNTEAELRKKGELLEINPKRVTERIEKLLKVDYELFSRAIYSEQNQIDHFLRIPKGKRKEKIDELLRIDKFEKARKTASSFTTRLADMITDKEIFLKREEKEVHGLEKLMIEANETEEKRKKASEQLKETTSKKEELENSVRVLEEKKHAHSALQAKTGMLEERRTELAEKVLRYEKTELSEKEVIEKIGEKQEKLIELEQKEKKSREKENRKQELLGRKRNIQESIKETSAKIVPTGKEEIEELRTEKEAIEKKHETALVEEKELAGKTIGLKSIADGLEKEIEGKKSKKELLEKLDPENKKKELEDAEKELEKTRQRNGRLLAREEFLEKGIKELKDRKNCPLCETQLEEEEVERIRKKKTKELEMQKQESLGLEKRTEELKQKKTALEHTLTKAKTLEIETSGYDENKELYESKKIELEEKTKELEQKQENQKSLKEKLDRLRKDLDEKKRNLELAEELERKKEKFTEIEKEIIGTEKEMLEFSKKYSKEMEKKERREIDALRNIQEGLKVRGELGKTRTELEQRKKETEELSYSQEEYEKEKREYKRVIEKWGAANANFSALSRELIEKKKRIEEIKEKKERTDKMRSDIEKLKKSTDYLKEFQNALTSTQVALREEFIQVVNESMDSLWEELYPYHDYTSAKIEIEKGDYALKLLGSDGWAPVEIVSGGERAVAVLALRVAFSVVLAPQLRWLILDEPTHNLDEQGIEELSTLLREKIGKYMDQVFLITHERGLEQAATGYMYRLERDKSGDSPTKAVAVDVAG